MALGAGLAGAVGRVAFAFDPSRRLAARIGFEPGGAAPEDRALAGAIPARRTTRLPFRGEPVPAAALARLGRAAERLGCHLALAAGRRQLGRVARLVAEGAAANLADAAVYEEFYGWVRTGRRDPRSRRDGLTLQALALGRVGSLAAPWLLPPARMRRLARVGLHRAVAATQGRLARRCPVFCLLVAASGEPAGRFAGGRALLRVWLEATALDLRVHPMTAAMDHPDTRAALAAVFGVPAGSPMVACFRLGSGPLGPRSPRLPAGELLAARGGP